MDGPFLVQFVDRISATPTLRLDVCGAIWSLGVDSDLSPPPLERAYAGSLLADGRPVTSAAYGNRLIRLELVLLDDATAEQAATHVQRLAQELNRPANILLWQPGTTAPVFFRTLRGEFGKIYWDVVEKRASVLIPAEPFAYGLREVISPATVYPDPAHPSAPLNANPYFETNVSGWTGTNATLTRVTSQFHEGAASMLVTSVGTPAQAYARAEIPVTPGMWYTASVWVRCTAGYAPGVQCSIDWFTGPGGTGYISTTAPTPVALAAATWEQRFASGAAPATALYAQAGPTLASNPPAGTLLNADEAQIGVIGASGSNGCFFDVTGVRGDVQTPLIARLPGTGLAKLTSVFAARRRGTPSAAPLLAQAEGMALMIDASLPGNDALMSGAGSNYVRVSFATASMQPRIQGSVSPLAANVDMRGTYRVFGRMRHSVAADIISARLAWNNGLVQVLNDPVTLHTVGAVDATGLHWYDLGLIQMPAGPDPVHDGYSGVEIPAEPATVTVHAQRVSGSGNLDVDCLLLVPADDQLLLVTWPSPAGDQLVLDGTHEMVLALLTTGSTRLYGPPPAQLSGGFPMLSPGVTNRILYLRSVNSGSVGQDVLTGTTTIDLEYYPRYLFVRQATS